jgi:hypothetical protein
MKIEDAIVNHMKLYYKLSVKMKTELETSEITIYMLWKCNQRTQKQKNRRRKCS